MAAWLHKTLGARIEAVVTIAGSFIIAIMGLQGVFILPEGHLIGKISSVILLVTAGCLFCRGIRILRSARS
jgi:hypothetical protein